MVDAQVTDELDPGMSNNWQCDNSRDNPSCSLQLASATEDFIAGTYLVTFPLRSHDGTTNYFGALDQADWPKIVIKVEVTADAARPRDCTWAKVLPTVLSEGPYFFKGYH